jgi:hypothetical protein
MRMQPKIVQSNYKLRADYFAKKKTKQKQSFTLALRDVGLVWLGDKLSHSCTWFFAQYVDLNLVGAHFQDFFLLGVANT